MRVADLDAAFPDRVWTFARGQHAATTLIPATVTHLARRAVGLRPKPCRDTMLAAIVDCLATNDGWAFTNPPCSV